MKKSRILTALRGAFAVCMAALLLFGCTVGVFAVDPTTPSSGGGDFASSTIATGTKKLLSDVAG